MSTPSAKMLVSVGEKYACVKIAGRANFTSSIDFKTLMNELFQKGYAYFVLDLTDCVLMDSTFLGVLAGFGLRTNGPQPDQVERAIEIFKPNSRISELLETLGVLHLFRVKDGELKLPEQTESCETPAPGNPSAEEMARNCLEAHRILMDINPDNVARFKDVATFLAEDLKKLKAAN